jgi:hypothetical protein
MKGKTPDGGDTMGTLVFWGVIGLGVCLGILLLCLLTTAKRSDQIYERLLEGEEIASPANSFYRPACETLPHIASGEAQPQRDLNASVAAS